MSYDHWKSTDPADEWLGPDIENSRQQNQSPSTPRLRLHVTHKAHQIKVMIIDKIWEYIDTDKPFTIHLSDGRSLYVRDHHWIGAHPSRKSSSITVYGPTDDEEHYVPLFAITSLDLVA